MKIKNENEEVTLMITKLQKITGHLLRFTLIAIAINGSVFHHIECGSFTELLKENFFKARHAYSSSIDKFILRIDKHPDADNLYQTLAEEARQHFGIKHPVYIKNVNSSYDEGEAFNEIVHVNESYLTNKPYGYKRFVMFHELAHIKNVDRSFNTFDLHAKLWFPYVFYIFFRSLLSKNSFDSCNTLLDHIYLNHIIMTGANLFQYGKISEHRADMEAAEVCQCWKDIAAVIEKRKTARPDLYSLGYATIDDLTPIKDRLKSENKLCKYHQSHPDED